MTNENSAKKIDDQQLLAYLDGEVDPETAARIERSETYLKRARELAQLQDRLRKRLFRIECPEPIDLGEYQMGLLPDQQAAEIRTHLKECPHCQKELAQLAQFLEQPEARASQTGLIEEVKVLVARLISDTWRGLSSGPSLTPAYGLRGEEEGGLIYTAGDMQIALDLQEDPENPGKKTVLGLVTGLEPDGVEVKLYSDEELIDTAEIDELDNFTFSNVSPGQYELILHSRQMEIHITSLKV